MKKKWISFDTIVKRIVGLYKVLIMKGMLPYLLIYSSMNKKRKLT